MARQVQVLVLLCLVTPSDEYWTRWFDRSSESNGDIESLENIHQDFPNLVCKNPSAIDVKTSNGTLARETGEVFYRYDSTGFVCLNDQQDDGMCQSYKVRFCCPGKTGATMCANDEELKKYQIMHNYTLSIQENLELGSTVFKLTEEPLASVTESLDIVHGNQFNRFGVDEESKSIIVANLMDADITEDFHLVVYSNTMSMETMAFGLHISLIDVEDWPPYYNKTCETPIKIKGPSSNVPFYDVAVDGILLHGSFLSLVFPNKSTQDSNNSKCILHISSIMQGEEMRWLVKHAEKQSIYDIVMILVSQDYPNYREDFTFDAVNGNATHFHFQRFTKDGRDVTHDHTIDPLETYLVRITLNLFNAPQLTWFRLLVKYSNENRNQLVDYGVVNFKFTGCPSNKYGGFCQYDCQCKNGATCHAWNGACQCTEAWRGPACDIPMEPYAVLSVITEDTRFYSSLRLQCLYFNIYRNPIFLEVNGKRLSEDLPTMLDSKLTQNSALFVLPNMTQAYEGTFICRVFSSDEKIFAVSNKVNVSITGCQSGAWGQYCEHQCNCVHYTNCDRYQGCVCENGWEGVKCDLDIQAPLIECPSNITQQVEDTSGGISISWPTISSTDNDGPPIIVSNFQPGDIFDIGTTVVTYEAVDRNNNTASCSFTVTIKGTRYTVDDKIRSWGFSLGFTFLLVSLVAAFLILRKVRREQRYTPLLPQPIQIPDGVTVVKRSEVLIGHLLGEGEFSSVYFGRLRMNGETTNVAVKILKDNTLYNPAYEHEISTLEILAGCPHIIKLLGVIIDGEKSIITELMTSDMYTILKSLRQENDFSATTGARLQKFCLEVAEALQYMTTMKIVHRDVAARNVLISHDDTAKIGDFGLARDIYQDLVYQRHPSQRHCKVPVRWMSPESLTENIYTPSSDMWSFGVLMWEVATLGDMPFYNIDSEQLVERLKAGDRLPRPPNCSEDFYELMKKCWRLDPKDRVTANVAVRILKHYIAYKRLPVAC